MPNLDPWINQCENNYQIIIEQEEVNSKFEKHLLSVRTECQKTIDRNSHQHPAYFERYKKIIEMIDWTLERYRIVLQRNKIQHQNEQDLAIINRIIKELDEKKKKHYSQK
jgi:hypothetical protein